jgi:hypothetical protein
MTARIPMAHVAATPALDYAILTIHDNDMVPVSTHIVRRTP